jgi:hypothetical protein
MQSDKYQLRENIDEFNCSQADRIAYRRHDLLDLYITNRENPEQASRSACTAACREPSNRARGQGRGNNDELMAVVQKLARYLSDGIAYLAQRCPV